MRSRSARLALAFFAVLSAASASAQTNPLARPQPQGLSQEGFFRPTPDGDPSLTKYRPPAPAQQAVLQSQRATPVLPAPVVQEAITMRGPDSNPVARVDPVEQARWTEEQLDRTEREGERERQRALMTPPPVAPGAYDGTTSERNR